MTMEPLDEAVDHVRGSPAGRLIVEYGDYECPYSRQAFREIGHVEARLGDGVRFAFRHFPLTEIHPHALAASAAAEAAALQERFWDITSCSFTTSRRWRTTTCGATPSSSSSTSRDSTATGPAPPSWRVFAAMSRAGSRRARCAAPLRCSSTARCTSAATTRMPCWRRWSDERDLLAPGHPSS